MSYLIYDYSPYSLSPKILKAIGLLIACSAQTEDIFEQAIAGALGLDFEYGMAVTTHMPMPLRLSVLRSAAEIRIDDLDALDELDDLLEEIEQAFGKRNAIAHHQWCSDPKTGATFTVKETARVSVQADLLPMSVDQIESDALFIYNAGLRLFQFLKTRGLQPPVPPSARPRGHKSKAARKERRKKLLSAKGNRANP
jgi:hypothetical protein